MTGRQTIVVLLTALVAVGVAGLVQQAAGWLVAAVALVVVAVVGGLVGRYLNRRDLDRHRDHPTQDS